MVEYFTRMEWTRVTSINRFIMNKYTNGKKYPDASEKGQRGLFLLDTDYKLLNDYDIRVPESTKQGDVLFVSSHMVEKLGWNTTKATLTIKRIDMGPDGPTKPNGQPLNWRATYCGRQKDNLLLLALLRVCPQIDPLRYLRLRMGEHGTPHQVENWLEKLRSGTLSGDKKPWLLLPDYIQQELGLLEHKHLVRAFKPPPPVQAAQPQLALAH